MSFVKDLGAAFALEEENEGRDAMDASNSSIPQIMIEDVDKNCSTPVTTPSFSPPYKRVRALRLFGSPCTPKTILQKSAACATPKVRLFGGKPKPVPAAYPTNKPVANINPFTPKGLLLSKKRTRSIRSPDVSFEMDPGDGAADEICDQPTKRIALQERNISRYHQEFHELELIGKGEFGSVYKCLNRLDGCVYAIKKSSCPVTSSRHEKIALNEVYAHAVLGNHQHVVRYFSAWTEDNHMIIQNEYCNGGSLADKIAQEALNLSELRQLIMHVAEGLRYLHSEGLVHMDIKPGNIFISYERRVHLSNYDSADDGFEDVDDQSQCEEEVVAYKIGDLGHVTSLSNPQVEEGDCRYLPVEILHEDYSHLTKADIFSLGLTAYEAAGGGPLPKNGDEWHKLRSGQTPVLPHMANCEVVDVIASMIHPDPVMRPSAVQILQHRALSPSCKKTKAELQREVNAWRLKSEILSKQLQEAATCIKSLTPEVGGGASTGQLKGGPRMKPRLVGKATKKCITSTF